MPITVPAHQLVILPLLRDGSRLPGLALVVGTILPDLAFVVGGYGLNARSHLMYGPLMMAPLGLALILWCEALLLPALRAALPAGAARLCVTRGLGGSWRTWTAIVVALLLGAYSHVLFDGFTHAKSWPARELYSRDVARALQAGCSIVGSIVVLIWLRRRARTAPPCEAPRREGGLRVLAAATLAGAAIGLAIGLALLGWPETRRQLVRVVLSPGALGAFAGATAALLTRRR